MGWTRVAVTGMAGQPAGSVIREVEQVYAHGRDVVGVVEVLGALGVGVVLLVAGWLLVGVNARRASKAAARGDGYDREVGRQAAADDLARQERERHVQAAEEAAKAKAAASRAEGEAYAHRVAALEKERIGARFVEHPGPGEPDVSVTVESLDPGAPLDRVMVRRVPAGGSTPDGWLDRLSVRWSALTEAARVQQHRNARLMMRSDDDADGWLTYERVEPIEAGAASGADGPAPG